MIKSQNPLIHFWKWWFTPRASDPTVRYRERALRVLLLLIIVLRPLDTLRNYSGDPAAPKPYAPIWVNLAFFLIPILFSFYFLARQKLDLAAACFLLHWYLIDLLSLAAEGYWYPGFQISLIIQLILGTLLLPSRAILPFMFLQLLSVGVWGDWLDLNYYDPPLLASGQPVAIFRTSLITLAAQEALIVVSVRYLRLQMEKSLVLQQESIQQLQSEMTEHQQTELARQRSEDLYRQAIMAAGAVPYVLDHATRTFTFIGEGILPMTGYSATELMGAGLWNSLVQQGFPRGNLAHLTYEEADRLTEADNSIPWECDFQIRTRNGQTRWIADTSVKSYDEKSQHIISIGIKQDITARKEAEENILRLNETLEARVIERTAQLETVNKDLEAFSYSVSHDLRAPLRSVVSFSKILADDFSTELSPTASGFLHRIIDSGVKMNVLINELLDFSRLGRKPLELQTVDLNPIVKAVLETLTPETASRQIEWILADLPSAAADPVLIQQVFANLIGNAVKYSRNREVARIEVGSSVIHGETVYHVRDNGAGFEMQYADKLFGVFQRLHRDDEFEGTGIGLATVQRILQRHGGRIWAEAKRDQGAAFYFTLSHQLKR